MRRHWSARGWFFKTRKGTVSVTEPPCRSRIPRGAPDVLSVAIGAPRGGLPAAHFVALVGHLPETVVRLCLKGLARLRLLNGLGDDDEQLRFTVTPLGMAHLERHRRKLEKRPVGRPRKYPEGAPRPKRVYKTTGRPRGRPRKYPTPPARTDARGRKVTFHDLAHAVARESAKRAYAARRVPRKRLRDMGPEERDAYYLAQRQDAAARSRSWRRWDTAARLAVRHVAASPPEPDELSAEALAWLQEVA